MGCALLKIGLLAAIPFLAGCLKEDPMLVACETSLKKRLAAPSTYKRTDLVRGQREIPLAQIYGSEPGVLAAMERNGKKGHEYRLFISYDVQNRMGVPIRSIVMCTYETSSADAGDASEFTVKIDGKTSTEWLIDRIKEQRSR